ncbi:MAG: hypothetical protein ACR2LI_10665 [Propionibacteriaceae bacterium]
MSRCKVGDQMAPRTVQDAEGQERPFPAPSGLTHLQVRRFAGCPICDRHLAPYVSRQSEIVAAGVTEVIVFKSTPAQVRRFEGDLPFVAVPDPDARWYAELDVRSTPRALLHPKAVGAFLAGVVRARSVGGSLTLGDHLGLPADVLLDAEGMVLGCEYGTQAADGWTVDRLLELAAAQVPG